MIDLTKKGLPNAIIGDNGEPIFLNTDYRYWIKFSSDLENEKDQIDISYLFADEPPVITESIHKQLLAFLYNPSVTPVSSGSSNVKTLDYLLDGEYIFSAIWAVYGIDITEIDMHWHKFQALCNNIVGEDTLWGYAKQMRAYKKPNKSDTYDKHCQNAKIAWTFPRIESEEEQIEKQKKRDEFDAYFAGTEYKGGGS